MSEPILNENDITPEAPAAEPKTFDQKYVESLRQENAKYRTQRNEARESFTGLETKAKEYDELLKKQEEEKGNYKDLYEKLNGEVESLKANNERLKGLEGVFNSQLEDVKKGLTEDQIKLVDRLPSEMPVEQKLTWAKELTGATKPGTPATPRAGGDPTQSADQILKDYEGANKAQRMEMLFAVEKTNPELYKILITK